MYRARLWVCCLMLATATGCQTWDVIKREAGYIKLAMGDKTLKEIRDEAKDASEAKDPEKAEDPDAGDQGGDELDPAAVVWNGPNVGAWKVSSGLSVGFRGGQIILGQSGTDLWRPAAVVSNVKVVANPWVIIKINGHWEAFTWEWMTPGSKAKNKSACAGDHIKHGKVPGDWRPKRGDVLYMLVSGLARGGKSNVAERTHIVRVVWQ